jgi:hypothetical protein
MEEKRNYRGLKRYEPLLQTICCTDDYYRLSKSEWEGCLGVACTISVIEGVPSNLLSLSKHLDIPVHNRHLQAAFDRLKINGILSNKYNVKADPSLTGNAVDSKFRTSAETERHAWCTIAGVAGGFAGLAES